MPLVTSSPPLAFIRPKGPSIPRFGTVQSFTPHRTHLVPIFPNYLTALYSSGPPALADMQDAETSAKSSADRDQEIATGNPLLNLQNALGQSPAPSATSSGTASFSVKRRWDDDLIFKNQAAGLDDKPKKGEFVNDLLRSEFHKKFMLK